MREADFLEALVCGFLVALSAALFVEYFGIADFGPQMFGIFIGGLALINFGILFLIAWPFRFSGVFVFFVIIMILGYAAYGPYASYLRGPMKQISESLSDMPEMAEKQMHCLMLIFTNPMAYQKECVLVKPRKLSEEKPENFGLEITNFEIQPPKKEIYAGMPLQIWMTLENKGDYDATNVLINSDGGEYEVCENLKVLNASAHGHYSDRIKKGTNHYFSLRGKINDPWDEKVKCTYAKNKMVIGGTIKTTYSYDYKTESYLEIEAIRNTNETTPNFRVESAKVKAAPANILMYTFVPFIWEGAEGSFREGIISVSLKNERKRGKIIFRGKYVHDSKLLAKDMISTALKETYCNLVCETPACIAECVYSFMEEKNRKYDHCAIVDSNGKELDKLKDLNENECENTKIWVNSSIDGTYTGCFVYRKIDAKSQEKCKEKGGKWDNTENVCVKLDKIEDIVSEDLCKSLKTEIFYRVYGKYERSNYDQITVYVVGEEAKNYINLSCDKNAQNIVMCTNYGEDKVKLTWLNDDLDLNSGDVKLVYSGIKISLAKWPNKNRLKLNFGIKANATYRVEMERTDRLQIDNPHYTD
ncbi:MAG: tripartite tricarboxylate transporter TctB family protein [Candidatus Aenigmarchaeota archaeon]|nr:tripartite tricarboxylate transporter TctB family protein [Candidatus Aenigmarchaeota archaeon]